MLYTLMEKEERVMLYHWVVKIMSEEQNIVTKGSIEAKIVGMSDRMSSNLELLYILGEQGYDIKPLILYQDNKSTITLMEKGRHMVYI